MGTKAATSASSYQEAERKARCGNRDWLAYTDKDGNRSYVPCTGRAIKAAMLAGGTQARFVLISAGNGCGMLISWRIACNMLKQVKYGWIAA